MKLLILDDALTFGGAQVALINLLKGLVRKKDYKITVCCSKKNDRLSDSLNTIPGLQVLSGLSKSKFLIITHFLEHRSFHRALELIDEADPDFTLINLPGIENSIHYMKACNRLGIPYAGWMHNPVYFSELMPGKTFARKIYNGIRDWLADKFIFPKYQNMIYVSSSAIKKGMKRSGKPVNGLVIENGFRFVSAARNQKQDKDPGYVKEIHSWKSKAKLFALIAGMDSHVKGHDLVLKAISRNRDNDIKILFVGDGPDRAEIEHYINEHSINDRVRITGWLDNLEPVYPLLDGIVIPSRFESFPLILLQAVSHNIPVICSDIPIFREKLSKDMLFNSGNAESLLDKMIQLYRNRKFANYPSVYANIRKKHDSRLWILQFDKFFKSGVAC